MLLGLTRFFRWLWGSPPQSAPPHKPRRPKKKKRRRRRSRTGVLRAEDMPAISEEEKLAQVESPERIENKLKGCQERIAYFFRDCSLLQEALTHSSGAAHRLMSNERMEFLGDAILGAVVCELLFHKYPGYLEGDLTKIKSSVVSRQTCARISHQLALQEFLLVGRGVSRNAALPRSLLADVLESLVAAIYLDGGIEAAQAFIRRHLEPEIEQAVSGQSGVNYKSILQQVAQRDFSCTPIYKILSERGPDHRKVFRVAAVISGAKYSPATGRNKKEAEQKAAHNALAQLDGRPIPYAD